MGRYKGIGMPKAKKKKVMQSPALESTVTNNTAVAFKSTAECKGDVESRAHDTHTLEVA